MGKEVLKNFRVRLFEELLHELSQKNATVRGFLLRRLIRILQT